PQHLRSFDHLHHDSGFRWALGLENLYTNSGQKLSLPAHHRTVGRTPIDMRLDHNAGTRVSPIRQNPSSVPIQDQPLGKLERTRSLTQLNPCLLCVAERLHHAHAAATPTAIRLDHPGSRVLSTPSVEIGRAVDRNHIRYSNP